MKKKNPINKDIVFGRMWNLFMSIVYFTLAAIILSFSYLLLQDDIHDFLNRKVYTKEEMEWSHKRALARSRAQDEEDDWDRVVDGIHVRTGLYDDPNLNLMIANCTSCHSSKLIIQNKATREGWETMIKWMQKTQGLGDLGNSEPIILDYLEKYYAPKETGRRKNLDVEKIKWYVLGDSR